MRTVLARIGGHAVGLLASNPLQLGGAIDPADTRAVLTEVLARVTADG